MKTLRILGFALLTWLLVVPSAMAEIEFFGTAKVKPTYYSNMDFDDDRNDAPALNEGGWSSGEHVRAELRLGWKAKGDQWRVKMIAEADILMTKDNADRSYYVGSEKERNPNTGGEFGIERAEMGYTFSDALDLSTGWDIRYLDIKSGGLLYGDDHPFIGLRGNLGDNTKYQALYLSIENLDKIGVSDVPTLGDWRAYSLKLDHTLIFSEGYHLTLSPIFAFSDNQHRDAKTYYYGLESLGKLGPVNTTFEFIAADGEFGSENGDKDISSMALFAGLELPINDMFNPYVAYRYSKGDDDKNDNDVEGWNGITDIGRFTPLMGMDGNILGEHLASGASIYGASLYAYAPERAGGVDDNGSTNGYGGIGNGGNGNNPGQSLIAVGTKGTLAPKLSYKTQAFFIWYDKTDNLINVKNPGKKVDDYAGTTFDLQVKYAFSKNFSIDHIFSAFVPGKGLEDQVDADDTAYVNMLTMAWTY